MQRSDKTAVAFVALLAVPFCAFGAVVLKTSLRTLVTGGGEPVLLMSVMGGVFAVVGIGLVAAACYGATKAQWQKKLQAENPATPWLWRGDWAQGRANSRTRSAMMQAWLMAALWNLTSAPIFFFVPQTLKQRPLAAIAFIFPLVGIGLFIWAVRETLAWFEFGKTWFEMASVPGVIGRELRGNIHARFSSIPDHGIQLKLSCINRVVTGSGKSQTVSEKILWRDERNVASSEIYPGPLGVLIPVTFQIPWNAMQTDQRNSQNSIYWLLEADADVPWVDYKDLFEVPVFRTKDTPERPEGEVADKSASSEPPVQASIVITQTSDGTEFYFPAARNPKFAAGLTTFVMLWTGFIGLMLYLHAPFFFPVVFGIFELLLGYGALQLWFGTSRVIIDGSRIRVKMGLFGGGKWQDFPKSQVLDIQAVIASQQGGATGTPFYDIHLLQLEHKNLTIGQTIRDKREAEWVVAQMKQALGGRMAAAAAVAR